MTDVSPYIYANGEALMNEVNLALFQHSFPHKVFICGHVITGLIWIYLMWRHVSSKKDKTK